MRPPRRDREGPETPNPLPASEPPGRRSRGRKTRLAHSRHSLLPALCLPHITAPRQEPLPSSRPTCAPCRAPLPSLLPPAVVRLLQTAGGHRPLPPPKQTRPWGKHLNTDVTRPRAPAPRPLLCSPRGPPGAPAPVCAYRRRVEAPARHPGAATERGGGGVRRLLCAQAQP